MASKKKSVTKRMKEALGLGDSPDEGMPDPEATPVVDVSDLLPHTLPTDPDVPVVAPAPAGPTKRELWEAEMRQRYLVGGQTMYQKWPVAIGGLTFTPTGIRLKISYRGVMCEIDGAQLDQPPPAFEE